MGPPGMAQVRDPWRGRIERRTPLLLELPEQEPKRRIQALDRRQYCTIARLATDSSQNHLSYHSVSRENPGCSEGYFQEGGVR